MARPCAEMRRALGVYVVGAISPTERDAVDRHLAVCADCRDELAGLAGLPALLSRVPPEDVGRLSLDDSGAERAPQPPPLQALARRAARLRRHRLWPALAAAAAAGLVVGGGAVAASSLRGAPAVRPPAAQQPAGQWMAVSGSDPRTHADATVRYAARPWGAQVKVQIRGVAAGTRCELEVIGAGGQDVPSGSWTVVSGRVLAWYPASSSVPSVAIRGFVISSGSHDLLTIPVR
jgi:anti-sigma factor RsiW